MNGTGGNKIDNNIKVFIHIILALLVSLLMQPVLAGSNVPDYKAVVTAQSGLNVRRGPGISSTIISTLRHGSTVTVTHHYGSWSRIELGPTRSAYVSRKFLKRKTSSTNIQTPDATTPSVSDQNYSRDLNVNDYRAKVTASALNVRSGPGTSYRIVGKRYRNDSVTVTHQNGIWLKLAWSQGSSAYVHGNYLRRAPIDSVQPGFEGIEDPEGLQSHPARLPTTANDSQNPGFDGVADPEGLIPHPSVINNPDNITLAAARMGIDIQLPMLGGEVDQDALIAQIIPATNNADDVWHYYYEIADQAKPFQVVNQQALTEELYWTPYNHPYDNQLGCIGWDACRAAWEYIRDSGYEGKNEEERQRIVTETKRIAATYCLETDCSQKFFYRYLVVELQINLLDGQVDVGSLRGVQANHSQTVDLSGDYSPSRVTEVDSGPRLTIGDRRAHHDDIVSDLKAQLEAQGYSVSNKEVSFGSSCGSGRCRPDIIYETADGKVSIIEVKSGNAELTIRQSEIYPQIRDGDAIPRGKVAELFGLDRDVPLKDQGYPNGIPIYIQRFDGA